MQSPVRHAWLAVWRGDRFLTLVGVLLLATLVPMLIGLAADARIVTGAPVWLKPAKFAISNAIYSFTFAWILGLLPSWRRVRWIASRTTGVVFVLEVAIIALQAWRGTTSHFNMTTPFNAALFAVMGVAIAAQTVAAVAVAAAVWRERFADHALGWALRFGIVLTIVGATAGGLMVRPSDAQLAELSAGRPAITGAHTVGAPDGGPGLPGTGWSREHGDLRAPHFLGLHAMQALPLIALLLRRRSLNAVQRSGVVGVAAASYASLFAILLWQALRGQSLVQPDIITGAALAVWALTTALGTWAVWHSSQRQNEARHTDWVSA